MYLGVPIPRVPASAPISRATPKSTSTGPRSPGDQVLRLHVPVHHLLLVDVLERVRGPAGDLQDLVERQAGIAALVQDLSEVRPAHQLHDEIEVAQVPEVVDHPHDARMTQPGEQARLDLEARGLTQVRQALDRDLAVARPRAEDRAHGTAGDRLDQLVTIAVRSLDVPGHSGVT